MSQLLASKAQPGNTHHRFLTSFPFVGSKCDPDRGITGPDVRLNRSARCSIQPTTAGLPILRAASYGHYLASRKVMSFDSLGLAPALLSSIERTGFTTPTPVQMAAIPPAMAGSDLMVSSQTGSGKTAAFMLPALHRIAQKSANKGRGVQVLVLTPLANSPCKSAKPPPLTAAILMIYASQPLWAACLMARN